MREIITLLKLKYTFAKAFETTLLIITLSLFSITLSPSPLLFLSLSFSFIISIVYLLAKLNSIQSDLKFAHFLYRINREVEDYLSYEELKRRGWEKSVYWEELEKNAKISLEKIRNLYFFEKNLVYTSVVLFVLGSLLFLGLAEKVAERLNFNSNYAPVVLRSYEKTVFEGEKVYFLVEVHYNSPNNIFLILEDGDTLLPSTKPTKNGINLIRFEGTFWGVGERRFWIQADNYQSKTFKLRVLPIPNLKNLKLVELKRNLQIEFPQTGYPKKIRVMEGDYVLRGNFEFSDSFHVRGNPDFKPIVKLVGNNTFELSLGKLRKDLTLDITFFVSKRNYQLENFIRIEVVEDKPPKIILVYPVSREIELPGDEKILLGFVLIDETSVLKWRIFSHFNGKLHMLKEHTYKGFVPQDTVLTILNLSNLNLSPGERARLFITATDISFGESVSDTIYIVFPSLSEQYEKFTKTVEETTSDFGDYISHTKELISIFQNLYEKIAMKGERLSEMEKLEIKENLNTLKEKLGHIENMVKDITIRLREMDALRSIDREIYSLAEEFNNILREIVPEEFRKLMENFEKNLEKMSPQLMRKSLKDLLENQRIIKENLERVLEVLKRYKDYVELKQIHEKISEIYEKEDILETKLKNEELTWTEIERNQGGNYEEFRKTHEKLEEINRSGGFDLRESKKIAESLLEEFESSLESAKAKNKERFLRKLTNIKKDLLSLREKIDKVLKDFKERERADVVKSLREIRLKLLYFSNILLELEKGILKETPLVISGVVQGLKTVDSELVEISKRSLIVGSLTRRWILRALDNLNFLLSNPNLDKFSGIYYVKDGRGYINRAILSLFLLERRTLEGEGSPMGIDELLSQIKNLIREQLQLAQSGENLIPLPIPVPSEIIKELGEMAELQGALREMLEGLLDKLAREGLQGYGEELLQTMDQARQLMEEAERDLMNFLYDEKTLEKQREAVERLLQAERAIKKREFTQKRKAEPGKPYEILNSPPPIREDNFYYWLKRLYLNSGLQNPNPLYENYLRKVLEELY